MKSLPITWICLVVTATHIQASSAAEVKIELFELTSMVKNDFAGDDKIIFSIDIINLREGRGISWIEVAHLAEEKAMKLSKFNSFTLPSWCTHPQTLDDLLVAIRVIEEDKWPHQASLSFGGERFKANVNRSDLQAVFQATGRAGAEASYLSKFGLSSSPTKDLLRVSTLSVASESELSHPSVINLRSAIADSRAKKESLVGIRAGGGRYSLRLRVKADQPAGLKVGEVAAKHGVPVQVRLKSIRCLEEADGAFNVDEGLFAIGLINLANGETAWLSPKGNAFNFLSYGIVLKDRETAELFGADTVTKPINFKRGRDVAVIVLAAEGQDEDLSANDGLPAPWTFLQKALTKERLRSIITYNRSNPNRATKALEKALDDGWKKLSSSKYGECRKFAPTGRVFRFHDDEIGDGTKTVNITKIADFKGKSGDEEDALDHTARYQLELSLTSLPITEDPTKKSPSSIAGFWYPLSNPKNRYLYIEKVLSEKTLVTVRAWFKESDGTTIEEWHGRFDGGQLIAGWRTSKQPGAFGYVDLTYGKNAAPVQLSGGKKYAGQGDAETVVFVRRTP